MWKAIKTNTGQTFAWDDNSTYVQEPPFFVGMNPEPGAIKSIRNARALAYLGDSVTTDHISPAGSIGLKDSPGREISDFQGRAAGAV